MYELFVDGGGTPTAPCYFSYLCPQSVTKVSTKWGKSMSVTAVTMERFPFSNLSAELLPEGCSLVDGKGDSTNNIAEYAALYYGLERFKDRLGAEEVTVYSDSQLVVNQVLGKFKCDAEHLLSWRNAILSMWWIGLDLEWVEREKIVAVLGH